MQCFLQSAINYHRLYVWFLFLFKVWASWRIYDGASFGYITIGLLNIYYHFFCWFLGISHHLPQSHLFPSPSMSVLDACNFPQKKIKNRSKNKKKITLLLYLSHLFTSWFCVRSCGVPYSIPFCSYFAVLVNVYQISGLIQGSVFCYTISTGPSHNPSQVSCCCPDSWRFLVPQDWFFKHPSRSQIR